MIMKKRNLITGGCGFLGSHLAKKLLEKGEEVIVLDNFFTGTKENIEELHKKNYLRSIAGLTKGSIVWKICEKFAGRRSNFSFPSRMFVKSVMSPIN